jgi:hypothetical protein
MMETQATKKVVHGVISPSADGDPAWVAGEAALRREATQLGEWLAAQGLDLSDGAHKDEGSRDRLYWRYGYFVALRHALEMLTSAGATVH